VQFKLFVIWSRPVNNLVANYCQAEIDIIDGNHVAYYKIISERKQVNIVICYQ
jgi:hypothetical protein